MGTHNCHAKPALFGREIELQQLLGNLKIRHSSTFLEGEAGIGKSALLDEFYNRLLQSEDPTKVFVGYFDKSKILLGASPIYPFVTILENLLGWVKNTEQINERVKGTMKRIVSATVEFGKAKGKDMAAAILQDVASKVGLEKTFDLLKDFLKDYGEQKSAYMLAEDYVSKNQSEAILAYLGIFQSLADEFKDRRFVLIFDQFESTKKASVDFLINFVNRIPDNFHIVISFRTEGGEESSDSASLELFEYARRNLIKAGSKPLGLAGLSEKDIGLWIKTVSGVERQLIPDLRRIKENSAGSPLLLSEWINQSKDLNYDEIDRSKLCEYVGRRKKGLESNIDYIVSVNKMAVLVQPLKIKELAEILDTKYDYIPPFLENLARTGLFEKRDGYAWFSHELIQKCLEDTLDDESKQMYHENAAKFYLRLAEENKKSGKSTGYDVSVGCAYHLHKAGLHEQSFAHNIELARYAAKVVGDLDLAERCYKRAIDDAKILGHVNDEKNCIYYMTKDVYIVWGRYELSLKNYEDLLKYSYQIADQYFIAVMLHAVGVIHSIRGHYDEASNLFNQSLSIERQLGDKSLISDTLHEIAIILYNRGEIDEALKLYNESLLIELELGDKSGIAMTLYQTAKVYLDVGRYDEALLLYIESLSTFRELGDKSGIASSLQEIAGVNFIRKEYDEALKLYIESLSISRELGNKSGIAITLVGIANLYRNSGRYDEALKLYNESLSISRELGEHERIALALYEIGTLLINMGKHEDALQYTLEAYLIFERLDSRPGAKAALDNLRLIRSTLGMGEEEINRKMDETKKNLSGVRIFSY